MKLALKDLRWHEDAAAMARRAGWVVFAQTREQQRPEDPTFMASKGGTVIAVWLRSAAVRPSRMPPLNRFVGVAGYCWSPRDVAQARMVLMTAALPPGGVSDGSA
ncbi:hypothetical protein [Streptomyces sp. NPDC052225]|uniref:hypothetical protein n=1 Tax=Streptomyces sp. NPDC052225 TaxID=3154949 RepID=UPI0034397817